MLIPFSTDTEVLPDSARNDRFLMKMKLGTIAGTRQELDNLRDYLGNQSEREDCLFQVASRYRTLRKPQAVRKKLGKPRLRADSPPPNPLFSGNLVFSPYVGPEQRTSDICFFLDVNLSRIARMQTEEFIPPVLFENSVKHCALGEEPLDGKFNWILSGDQDAQYTPEKWNLFVQNLFPVIRETVMAEFQKARDAAASETIFVQEAANFVDSVESYWEFDYENPVALVREISGLLGDFSQTVEGRDYPLAPGLRKRYEGNSPTLSFKIKAGVFLKIYAKTSRRVRFEVVHVLKDSAAVLKKKSDVPGRYTISRGADDQEKLLEILQTLRIDGAGIVNRALRHIGRKNSIESSGMNQFAFVATIGAIAKSSDHAVTIVELLRTRGSVDGRGLTRKMKTVVEALKRKKILLHNKDSRVYQIHPQYDFALQGLMNYPDSLLKPVDSPLLVEPQACSSPALTAAA